MIGLERIGDYLVLNARRYPDNIAVVQQDRRITYRELNERVNRLANNFLEMGLQKGDHVGFMFYNSIEIIELFYAVMKIGAVAVPLNFRMIPSEVKWCLDSMKCKAFIYSEACAKQVAPVKNVFKTVEHIICSGEKPSSAEHSLTRLTGSGDSEEPEVNISSGDESLIIMTGGTTGPPKGALHTHRSFICSGLNVMSNLCFGESSEIALIHSPMFHIIGLNLTNSLITIGGKIIIPGKTFYASETLHLIQKERVTYILLVPPATYGRLLDLPELKDFDISSVRTLHSGGGYFGKALMARLFDAFPNIRIKAGYGQSESPVGTSLWVTRSMVRNNDKAIGSIGRVSTFAEVRLVNDHGEQVPVGKVGEAVIRGPHIMNGYFNQPDLTAKILKDGWVYTGDLLRRDKDGYFYFMDRKKDMIKSGGENIFAPEVEGVISSHPSVERCAVIGIPDAKFGEAVMAVIKLKVGLNATEEEIIEHCKVRLSSYKKPRRIKFVDTLPITEAGSKVRKDQLRQEYSMMEEG